MSLPLLAVASAAIGQTAQPVSRESIDPQLVEFDPSSDHDGTLPDGAPRVQRYELELFYAGALQPFQVLDLGKPLPEFDGKIRVDFLGYLGSWLPPGFTYEARVNAVGPDGSSVSLRSNSFAYNGACLYRLEGGLTMPATGGLGNLSVMSGRDCMWMPNSSADWLAVQSDVTTGSGTVSIAAAPNLTATARTATVTVGDGSVTVTQAGTRSIPARDDRKTGTATVTAAVTVTEAVTPTQEAARVPAAGAAPTLTAESVTARDQTPPEPNRIAATAASDAIGVAKVSPHEVLRHESAAATPSGVRSNATGIGAVQLTVRSALPSIRVSATTLAPGEIVTVTVAHGPANRTDWVGLYAADTEPNGTTGLTWQYLSGAMTPPAEGVSDSTLTFAMPSTPGTYKLRLLQGDSYTVLASSGDVVIAAQPVSTSR